MTSKEHVSFIDPEDDSEDIKDESEIVITLENSKEKINIDTISTYYKKAKDTNNMIMLTEVDKFIKDLRYDDTVKLCNDNRNKNKSLYELLIRKIMDNINKISIQSIKLMSYEMLYELITREDYTKLYSLENILCALIVCWFSEHKNEDDITSEKFLECWNKLRKSLLTPITITKVVSSPFYNSLEERIAPEIVKLYTNVLIGSKISEKERYKTYVNKNVMTEEECKKLKLGEIVDAQDKEGTWYVATIIAIGIDKVRIHFSGWTEKYDEWILFKDNRIAELGSITNGIEHTNSPTCKCVKCQNYKSSGGISSDQMFTANMLQQFVDLIAEQGGLDGLGGLGGLGGLV